MQRLDDNQEGEELKEEDEVFRGSELDTKSLETIKPISREGPHLEFRIEFKQAGSFFI